MRRKLGTGMPRRAFLQASAVTASAAAWPLGCTGKTEVLVADDPGPRWLHQARIAGIDFSDPEEQDVDALLNAAVRAGASVVEGDSVLSDYLLGPAFERRIGQIDLVAQKCHDHGLKVVWYMPSLEVVTADAERPEITSIYKEYPDWVQISIDRKPNVFYGTKEHWVDPGAESAWMCHASGYRDYFFERVRKLAGTRLDGLWIDVPLYMDTVLRWCCFNPACIKKFKQDTGLSMDALREDWSDPIWRTWIAWRREEIHRFTTDILAHARSVNPRFEIIIETVTMDTDIATVQALDGAARTKYQLSKPFPGTPSVALPSSMNRVWEVDSVSNDFGMRPAVKDDWICKLRAYKFAKAADRGGPSWVFSYGHESVDAGLVMGAAVACGCPPYETKTPQMVTTVGDDFRGRMFQWIKANKELLFDATVAPVVGLVHSSATRDYVDQGPVDTAFFVSATNFVLNPEVYEADKSFFWGGSVADTQWCADYGGLFKALSHLHVPFHIVPLVGVFDDDVAGLSKYQVLFVPSLTALSDMHVAALRDYRKAGGHLLVTGTGAGGLALGAEDELGRPRPEAARLDTALGVVGLTTPTVTPAAGGAGALAFHPERVGRAYFRTNDAAALAFVRDFLDAQKARPFVMDDAAFRDVHVERSKLGGKTLLHLVNYSGAPEKLVAMKGRTPLPFASEYTIVRKDVVLAGPDVAAAKRVTFASPDVSFRPDQCRRDGDKLTVAVHQYTMVVLE